MVDRERMDKVKANFSGGSADYDDRIVKIIPRYDEMLHVLASCIPSGDGRQRRVIDIGCGTGGLSAKLLATHPDVELTCLDMTKEMLDLAKERLGGYPNVRYILSDFHDFEFDGPYDHAITSLALHHAVTDDDKKAIYRKIFDALGKGGSFYNADLVLGSDDEQQELYMRRWTEFARQGLTEDEVQNVMIPRFREEDSPAKLTDHLRWLGEVGFSSTDVIWKWYNFAVYCGRKQ